MNWTRAKTSTALATSALLLATPVVRAQKDMAGCKPIIDAQMKTMTADSHIYGSSTLGSKAKPEAMEMIRVGDAAYIQVSSQWKKSPLTRKQMVEQEQENIKNATTFVCHRLRDEMVGTTPTTVYSEKEESEDSKSAGTLWVARSSGLIVKEEIDLDPDDKANTSHTSMRFEYSNVRVPPGAR